MIKWQRNVAIASKSWVHGQFVQRGPRSHRVVEKVREATMAELARVGFPRLERFDQDIGSLGRRLLALVLMIGETSALLGAARAQTVKSVVKHTYLSTTSSVITQERTGRDSIDVTR
jgi:hypothetical protein